MVSKAYITFCFTGIKSYTSWYKHQKLGKGGWLRVRVQALLFASLYCLPKEQDLDMLMER